MIRLPIILLIFFISFVQTSFAGANNDRIAGNRTDYLKNKIAGGYGHTLEIRNGRLWAWGQNTDGQLGDGTTTDKNTPTQIGNADNWISVAAGAAHSLGLKADGTLWAWGQNTDGQLGDGTTTKKTTPVQVGSANTWLAVACNGQHNLAIKVDGTLWAWGRNIDGQLGDGTNINKNVPVQIGSAHDWVTITAGVKHSLAIKANGTLWAWGANTDGQLGVGSRTNNIVPVQMGNTNKWISVAAGELHTMALQANGTLWAWGKNNYGQLGDSTYTDTTIPVQIDTARNWKNISVGAYHSIALKANGTLWAWGRNDDGELGDRANGKRNIPVHVDTANRWKSIYGCGFHTLGIRENGVVIAWGDNANGQLGDGTTTDKNFPVMVHKCDEEWLDIAAYGVNSIGLKMDGTLFAWGANNQGQIGDGTDTNRNTHVLVSTSSDWVSVAIGFHNTFAIKANGTLWAWGENNVGQLGDSTTIGRKTPVQIGKADDWVSISADYEHTMALKADGTLWIWGSNSHAQLGDGTTTGRISPIQLGTSDDWTCISAKGSRSYAIKSNGTLWGWGYNWEGLLGIGFVTPRMATPVQIGTDTNWVTISVGQRHCMAQKADGTLWVWGDDQWDQCGGTVNHRYQMSPMKFGTASDWVSIAAGGENSRAINSNGTLWAFGWNGDGALGLGNNSSRGGPDPVSSADNWVKVVGGNAHSIGIKANRTIICATGFNGVGSLGDGTNTDRYTYHCYCMPVKTYAMPASKSYCEGADGSFVIKGSYSTTHLWQVNSGSGWTTLSDGGIYSHTNTDSLVLTNITAAYDKYWYRCVRGNYCSESDTSDSAQLKVNIKPAITAQPYDSIVCANTNVAFILAAIGSGLTYEWQVNDGSGWVNVTNSNIYNGVTTDTLTLTAVTSDFNGYKYRCIVNGICTPNVTSSEAILKIKTIYNPPTIIVQPRDKSICENANASFSVQTTDPNVAYQWQVNNGTSWTKVANTAIYSGVNGPNLLLTQPPHTMNGYQYRCVLIRDCAPLSVSSPALLTVDTFVATSVSLSSNDNDICAGQLANFLASPVNGGTSPTFQWQINGMNVGTNSNSFSTSLLSNGDMVKCNMTSDIACPLPKTTSSNVMTIQVTQNVTPTLTITSDVGNSWCSGKETIFRSANTGGGDNPVYQWKINGMNIGPDADTLWVSFLNHGDAIECEMESSYKCPTPKNVISNKINMTIKPTTIASIQVMPNPDSIICDGSEVAVYCAFTNGGSNPKFQWMLNGTDMPGETSGTLKMNKLKQGDIINCRLTSSGVCVFPEVSSPISFDVNPILNPTVKLDITYLGNNENLFTAISGNGGTNPTYIWYVNGQRLKDEHGSNITLTGTGYADKVRVDMASSEECIPTELRLVSSNVLTTNVSETQNRFSSLNLHPNPNNGDFTIKGDLAVRAGEKLNITILNSLGQVIHRETVLPPSEKLSHSIHIDKATPAGTYMLKIDSDGKCETIRFVIMK